MIKALVFDCFGVLYWDDINRLYNLVPSERFQDLSDLVHAADHGFIRRDDFFAQAAALANVSEAAVRAVTVEQFRRNEQLIDRVKELKSTYKTALLSNMGTDTLDEVFGADERKSLFDAVVVSSEVGLIKPSRDIFEHTLEQLGTPAAETVLIDDRPANVEGADRVGMKTILFSSNAQFEHDLSALTDDA